MSETLPVAAETQLAAVLRAARAAPLSARRAMLAALLIDQAVDALFTERHAGAAADILAFRTELAERFPPLATLFALTALRPDGPRLGLAEVEVPIAHYSGLSVEDFMVSLYNDRTVQRLLVLAPDGARLADAQQWLAAAADALQLAREAQAPALPR